MEAVLAFTAEVGTAAAANKHADRWLMGEICRLVAADECSYGVYDATGTELHGGLYPNDCAWVPTTAEATVLRAQNPFRHYATRLGSRYFSAKRLSDLIDLRAFRRLAIWQIPMIRETPYFIEARMPGPSGTTIILEVDRSGRDFTGRDVLIFDALRAAVRAHEAHRAAAAMSEAAGTDGSVAVVGLSTRENQVLDLVAVGATNSEIGRRLLISEATVRKHLEHTYLKLEVTNRTSALARTGRSSAARQPVGW